MNSRRYKTIIEKFIFCTFRSIPCIIFFAHNVISFSQPKPANTNYCWNRVYTPTREHLKDVVMTSPTSGYISGSQLLFYNGARWEIGDKTQMSFRVANLYYKVFDKNNVWRFANSYLNEVLVDRYNGTSWKTFHHPFANFITAIDIQPNGIGWYAGYEEIAFYSGKKWKFIPITSLNSWATKIIGSRDGQSCYVEYGAALYYYNNNSWQQLFAGEHIQAIHFHTIEEGYVITSKTVMKIKNGKWTQHSILPENVSVNALEVVSDNEMWAVGDFGTILHYVNNNWERIPSPTKEALNGIFMMNKTDGWIVGSRGMILRYVKKNTPQELIENDYFSSQQIVSISREINGEYGVAMEDFNNDNFLDVYTINLYESNRMYINKGLKGNEQTDGSNVHIFYDETLERGVMGIPQETIIQNLPKVTLGVGTSDVDNDGDKDIYMCNLSGTNTLFLNNGKGYFRDGNRQYERGAETNERTNAAIFGDVDNDGDLDLFVTNEFSTNRLFLNNGNGYFTDATIEAGLTTRWGGMCAAFGDIDNDGDLDLYVTNWAQANLLYKNEWSETQKIHFKNVSKESGTAGEFYTKSNAAAFADYDNDGDLDLFVTNRKASNRLYNNNGGGVFADVTKIAIGEDSLNSYGASFADFNNDGFLDIVVANVGKSILYRNIQGKKFRDVSEESGFHIQGYCTGTAAGDIDNDGDVDLYVSVYVNGFSQLFVNDLNNNNFISLNVEGTESNRDAIGAKVFLFISDSTHSYSHLVGFRELHSGSGYASHDAQKIHFGVQPNQVYDIIIQFPATNIKRVIHTITAGSTILVSEEDGVARQVTLTGKYLRRSAIDPENQKFAVSCILVSFGLFLSMKRGRKKYLQYKNILLLLHGVIAVLFVSHSLLFFYSTFTYSFIVPIGVAIISLTLVNFYFERQTVILNSAVEKKQTRDQIARDLHDDIASTLGSARIYASVFKQTLKRPSHRQNELLEKINGAITSASEGMTDIVWTIAPKHDSLNDLIARIRLYVSETAAANSMEAVFAVEEYNEKIPVSEAVRRNIYLIFKEAMNNIVKHSTAKKVIFEVRNNNSNIEWKIADDGKGFGKKFSTIDSDSKTILHGNGLQNMKERAKEIGAELQIDSIENAGTAIRLSIKMMQLHH